MEPKEGREVFGAQNELEVAEGTASQETIGGNSDTPYVEASTSGNQDMRVSNHYLRLGALAIVVIGTITYLNSFEGAFLFDDRIWVGVPAVQKLWPPWQAMFSPGNITRPLIGLSLALNYAVSQMQPWSYHAANLVMHLLAALTLFGIVRRTLESPRLEERFGKAAQPLALTIALIWLV